MKNKRIDPDKYIRINHQIWKRLKIASTEKETNIKALAEIYIRQGLEKKGGK